jgi:hypothetical protein
MGGFGLAMPQLQAPPINLRLKPPNVSLDLSSLDAADFIPKGATVIGSAGLSPELLYPEQRAWYPSTEMAASPDLKAVLFHEGIKQKRDITNWLALKREDSPITNAILSTTASFDAMWSPDSSRFVITHYVGGNSSEVFVVNRTRLEKDFVTVR